MIDDYVIRLAEPQDVALLLPSRGEPPGCSNTGCQRRVDAGDPTGSTVTFDYQPVLKGELVELRPLRADDYDDLYSVAADPLIWEQHPIRNRHEEATFQLFFQEALASGGALVAIDVQSQRIIGSSRFQSSGNEREVEIGWTFLARSHWGGSYNGEMKRLMVRHAFGFVSRVVFLVGVQNIRSQRAVERIGAVRAGTRPDAGGRDSYVYSITASTFAAQDG